MGSLSIRSLTPLSYVVLFSMTVGCQCKGEMHRFDLINVSLDKSLGTSGIVPSVEVDVIGVSESDLQSWTDKPVTEFFAPGSDARSDLAKYGWPFLLGQDQQSRTLQVDDQLWDSWNKRKIMYLVLLSNYPRLDKGEAGEGDPRRRIIPLTCERWDKEKELRILVRHDKLEVETPPLPKTQ